MRKQKEREIQQTRGGPRASNSAKVAAGRCCTSTQATANAGTTGKASIGTAGRLSA